MLPASYAAGQYAYAIVIPVANLYKYVGETAL